MDASVFHYTVNIFVLTRRHCTKPLERPREINCTQVMEGIFTGRCCEVWVDGVQNFEKSLFLH